MIPDKILPEIRAQIVISDGCWIWQGALNESGYGYVAGGGIISPIHRLMFEALARPIPEGYELDHLCRAPKCCNPEHLEPVTPEENYRRRVVSPREPQEFCRRGHCFTGKRTRDIGGRYCKICININRRELREVRREGSNQNLEDFRECPSGTDPERNA
jgi:hypothetical protein